VAAVHIPRPVTDLRTRVTRAAEELTNREGQSPSIQRLAEYLEVSVEDVLEAVQSDRARTAVSLSALDVDGETEDRGVPVDESGYEEVEARLFVADALETLDDRDRLVLRLRFEEGLSQSEIAARIGISQMHVSRLLRRACDRIRDELGEIDADEL
jgi:RNA polymerase sigma-B factor